MSTAAVPASSPNTPDDSAESSLAEDDSTPDAASDTVPSPRKHWDWRVRRPLGQANRL